MSGPGGGFVSGMQFMGPGEDVTPPAVAMEPRGCQPPGVRGTPLACGLPCP